jgi:hypothetical protein
MPARRGSVRRRASRFLARHLFFAALICGLTAAIGTFVYNKVGQRNVATVYAALAESESPGRSAVIEREVGAGWDSLSVRPLWTWTDERILQRLRREFTVDPAARIPPWAESAADRHGALIVGRVRTGWPCRAVQFRYWLHPVNGVLEIQREGAIQAGKFTLPYLPCPGLLVNVVCFGAFTAVFERVVCYARRSRRLRRGRCPACGYDLAALGDCAECGWRGGAHASEPA